MAPFGTREAIELGQNLRLLGLKLGVGDEALFLEVCKLVQLVGGSRPISEMLKRDCPEFGCLLT
jgi:hypothetical protein